MPMIEVFATNANGETCKFVIEPVGTRWRAWVVGGMLVNEDQYRYHDTPGQALAAIARLELKEFPDE